MDQPRADIIKNVLYSNSLYFLHSRKKISVLILFFFSFSSERFLYRSRAYWHSLSFSSSERFHVFDNNYLTFLYIEKKFKNILTVFFML